MKQNQIETESNDRQHGLHFVACELKKIQYYSVHHSFVIYKLWLLLRGLVAVAVVERWPLSRGLDESVGKDHPLRRNKCNLRQVAVVERWALMEVHNLRQSIMFHVNLSTGRYGSHKSLCRLFYIKVD